MGEKASLNLEKGIGYEYLGRIVIRARSKNHPRLNQNNLILSTKFFLLLLSFLNLLFLCFSFVVSLLWVLFHVIYHDFCTILTVHV